MTTPEIKIETGIPIPLVNSRAESMTSVISRMKIGESFIAPKKAGRGIRTSARSIGAKIATRMTSDSEIRVWRTA